jgi:hypothetical protein
MSEIAKPRVYRDIIDELVRVCREGQGQIGAQRVRAGIWNANATPDYIQDQHEINQFLARLSAQDRETLAKMFVHEVELGVFESLKVLEQFQIAPFEEGYEGSPYNDFVGRLNGWEWPEH